MPKIWTGKRPPGTQRTWGSATVTRTGDFKLASVKCLRLKNMEATCVLAATGHG